MQCSDGGDQQLMTCIVLVGPVPGAAEQPSWGYHEAPQQMPMMQPQPCDQDVWHPQQHQQQQMPCMYEVQPQQQMYHQQPQQHQQHAVQYAPQGFQQQWSQVAPLPQCEPSMGWQASAPQAVGSMEVGACIERPSPVQPWSQQREGTNSDWLASKRQDTRSQRGGGRRGNRAEGPARAGANPCKAVEVESMKTQLQSLQSENPDRVFIARRINKLGFASPEILRSHFARYGQVKAVHVSHSRVKSQNHRRPVEVDWRLRAAALGFVVMESAESTAKILSMGLEHSVKGVKVVVQPFQRWSGTDADVMGDDTPANIAKDDAIDDPVREKARSHSPSSNDGSNSDASTRPSNGSVGAAATTDTEDAQGDESYGGGRK